MRREVAKAVPTNPRQTRRGRRHGINTEKRRNREDEEERFLSMPVRTQFGDFTLAAGLSTRFTPSTTTGTLKLINKPIGQSASRRYVTSCAAMDWQDLRD